MKKNLIIDFIGQISDEDVEVVRSVFLVRGIGLVGPVDTDLLGGVSNLKGSKYRNTHSLVDTSTIQSLHGSLCCSWIVVLNKAVVKSLRLKLDRD